MKPPGRKKGWKPTRGRRRLQMLEDLCENNRMKLWRGQQKTEVQGEKNIRKKVSKPAVQQTTEEEEAICGYGQYRAVSTNWPHTMCPSHVTSSDHKVSQGRLICHSFIRWHIATVGVEMFRRYFSLKWTVFESGGAVCFCLSCICVCSSLHVHCVQKKKHPLTFSIITPAFLGRFF